jgi:hypothetical protein
MPDFRSDVTGASQPCDEAKLSQTTDIEVVEKVYNHRDRDFSPHPGRMGGETSIISTVFSTAVEKSAPAMTGRRL